MLKLKTTLLPLTAALFSASVMSHGYISAKQGGVAAGRASLCNAASPTGEQNTNCGQVQWEPQSVEGPEGFPEFGPEDGKLASAGLIQFSPLDEQTSSAGLNNLSKLAPTISSGRSLPHTLPATGNTTSPKQTGIRTSHWRVIHWI